MAPLVKRIKTKLLISLISLIIAFLLLVLATFAWFSVPAPYGSANVSSKGNASFCTQMSEDGISWGELSYLNFSNVFCGQHRGVYIKLTNSSTVAMTITLRMDSEGINSETPITSENNGYSEYYYLGSQIKVCDVLATNQHGQAINLENKIPSLPLFLLQTTAQNGGQASYVNNVINSFPSLYLVSNLEIQAQQHTTIYIDFAFADNGGNQNAYQGFGTNGNGTCYRKLSVLLQN